MKIEVGVIGAGAMGWGIAQVAATAGHLVKVVDTNEAMLVTAKKNLENFLAKSVEKQKISSEEAATI